MLLSAITYHMDIDQIISRVSALPEESAARLKEHTVAISYPKGHILLKAGKTEGTVYFLKKGIVRAYVVQEDHKITFWFGKEGEAVISMKSYVDHKPGYENIELLEDCELYAIKTANLRRLYEQDIHIANWGRKFAEQELIKTEERLISRQFKTASERYKELLQHNADLLQRVQLGHIASYLGITQVSLSRIRAEIR